MKRVWLVFMLSTLLLAPVFLSAGGGEEAVEEEGDAFKIAFVYIGPPGDLGWTYEHDGRLVGAKHYIAHYFTAVLLGHFNLLNNAGIVRLAHHHHHIGSGFEHHFSFQSGPIHCL